MAERDDRRDDTAPLGREIPADEIDDDDRMRPNEAFPLRDDLPGVEVTPPAQQHRRQNLDQLRTPVDPGVDDSHLRSPSQGVRPEPAPDREAR